MNTSSNLEKLDHFGIYALILCENKQKILLISKKRGPYTGLLDLPGGRSEFYETFTETLTREVREETGLNVKKCAQIKALLSILEFSDLVFRHVGVLYLADVAGQLNSSGDDQDSDGAGWFYIDDLDNNKCTPFVRQALLHLKENSKV